MSRSMFSMRLTSLRKARDMTQSDIAQMLDMNRSTYTCYEIGTSTPGLTKLCILADIFGVSLDYLVGRTNVESSPEVEEAVVSAEEMQLTAAYRMLNDRQRRAVRELLKSF